MNFIPRIEYTVAPLTVDFNLPPRDDFRSESIQASQSTTRSTNGTTQTQFNHNESIQSLVFTFLDEAIFQSFKTFFIDHGSRGLDFKYFESNDEVEFITVTLDSFSFDNTLLNATSTLNEFNNEVGLTFRRVL